MSGAGGVSIAFVLVVSGLIALFRDKVPPPRPQVIGVDIGTTYSCVAYFRPGNGSVEVVHHRTAPHAPLVPSVYYVTDPTLTADGNLSGVLAGHAVSQVPPEERDPTRYLFDLKRLIGRPYDDATAEEVREYPFTVVEGENGYSAVQFADSSTSSSTSSSQPGAAAGGILSTILPEVVTSHLVAELLANARAALSNKELHRAVIAVPVEFDEAQRNATVLAATRGGLTVERVLSEPTAAAMAYGLHKVPRNAYVVVYDMGGGTLDVATLSVDSGIFRTWAVAGDNHLGGESVNDRLVYDLAATVGVALPALRPAAGKGHSAVDAVGGAAAAVAAAGAGGGAAAAAGGADSKVDTAKSKPSVVTPSNLHVLSTPPAPADFPVVDDTSLLALRSAVEKAKILLSAHNAVEYVVTVVGEGSGAARGGDRGAGVGAGERAVKRASVRVRVSVQPAECPAKDAECADVETATASIAREYATAGGAMCDGDGSVEAGPEAGAGGGGVTQEARVAAARSSVGRIPPPLFERPQSGDVDRKWEGVGVGTKLSLGVERRYVLTRPRMERVVGDLGAALAVPIRDVLSDAELRSGDVDAIALVGGSTRMPLVRAVVSAYFCGRLQLDTSVPPEQAVAIGAAVQGGVVANSWPLPAVAVEDWEQLQELRHRRR